MPARSPSPDATDDDDENDSNDDDSNENDDDQPTCQSPGVEVTPECSGSPVAS